MKAARCLSRLQCGVCVRQSNDACTSVVEGALQDGEVKNADKLWSVESDESEKKWR